MAAAAFLTSTLAGTGSESAAEPHVRVVSARAEYPLAAARGGIRGPVVMDLDVDHRGKVSHVVPLRGHSILFPSAVAAVKRWRFRPESRAYHVIAGVNVAPARVGEAPTVWPGGASGGSPGTAALDLSVDGSGQAIDAIGTAGSREIQIEAVDSALRWETSALSNDRSATFTCRVDWFNGVLEFLSPSRCRFVAPPPSFEATQGEIPPAPIVLEVTIGADGRVRAATVLRSNPTLDEKAMEAVKQWRFGPLFVNGQPIAAVSVVTVKPNGRLTPR